MGGYTCLLQPAMVDRHALHPVEDVLHAVEGATHALHPHAHAHAHALHPARGHHPS